MKQKTIFWDDLPEVNNASLSLQQNKLIIGTTDTVLGLFAPANEEGFTLLNSLKERKNKPYLLIASSPLSIAHLINHKKSFHIEKLMKNFWPGPLTIIFKASDSVPSYFLSEYGTIAVRVPDHKGMQMLLEKNKLLFSTSANKSGESLPVTVKELNSSLSEYADYIIDDRVQQKKSVPSTLIDCSGFTDENPVIKILRKGKVSAQELKDAMGKNVIIH